MRAPGHADLDAPDTTQSWLYDARGRVYYHEDDAGNDFNYAYDDLDRLENVTLDNAPSGTAQRFYYDGLGRQTKSIDYNLRGSAQTVTILRSYDSLGRLLQEQQTTGSGATREVSYDYAPAQRIITYPSGRKIIESHRASGALWKVGDDDGSGEISSPAIAEYDYIGGRVLKRTMKNNVNLDLTDGSGTYYDALGRPTSWRHKSGSTTVLGYDLAYDRAGNPTAITDLRDSSHTYSSITYDSANRLVSSERDGSWLGQPTHEAWNLDGVGN